MSTRRIDVVVYADTDMNLIDGSSIWTQSLTLSLAATGMCNVTLLLKAPVDTDRLVAPLREADNVDVVDPFARRLLPELINALSPFQVGRILVEQAWGRNADVIVIRGRRIAREFVDVPEFHGRLWTYLTDVEQTAARLDDVESAFVADVARMSGALLCQTEELRVHFEEIAPEAAGKSWLLPPMVPDVGSGREPGQRLHSPLRLVYSGKFAPDWYTLEMTEIPEAAAARGIGVRLSMVGDKIHRPADDPGYHDRMHAALTGTPDVEWLGGMPRLRALEVCSQHDVGLSWRSQGLTASRELSTKVLEYCALGLPVILNRNPIHEELLGREYPLFAESLDEVVARLDYLTANWRRHERAASVCREAGSHYLMPAAVEGLKVLLDRHFPRFDTAISTKPEAVLAMSHDFKFFTRIQDHLEQDPRLVVHTDHWPALASHDEEETLRGMNAADVVICEWCGPNAIFASRNKRPGQRLIVRLHRFELYGRYPRQVDIDAVDAVVTVSPHYRDLVLEMLGWPADKVVVIPNWVDGLQLGRSKIASARYRLGMIGIAPMRKRLDLALDLLRDLRIDDPRYHLFVKSKAPWDYPWIWAKQEERNHYVDAYRRIERDPILRGSVVFDGFGPDVARWLRKIGYVLSTSDDESFHLAPAEGMASGALPVIRHWPGAETIYADRWIHESPAEMAEFIRTSQEDWDEMSAAVRQEVLAAYDLPRVLGEWSDLVVSARP